MIGCTGLVFGSTRSFPGRGGGSRELSELLPCWLCLNAQLQCLSTVGFWW